MRTKWVYISSVLPLLVLPFAVSTTAMAQLIGLPPYRVLLTGTPDDPVVLNQSPQRILAFALRLQKGDQDRFPTTRSNQVGLGQLKTPNAGPSGPGIPPGGTSLSLLPQPMAPQTKNAAGQRTDIGYTEAKAGRVAG